MIRKILAVLMAMLLLFCASAEVIEDNLTAMTEDCLVEFGEEYTSKDEVALYLHVFQQLPCNFITKSEAEELGWKSSRGYLWDFADGMSIGGDRFGNREGLLPRQKDRVWYECDIDYAGKSRNAKRIVFSNDGLVYYTEDHYESFDPLYEGWYDPEYWLAYPEYLSDPEFECYVEYEYIPAAPAEEPDDYDIPDDYDTSDDEDSLDGLLDLILSLFGE